MSSNWISTSYTIEWCRNWLPVTKIVKTTGKNNDCVEYSDLGTDTTPFLWIEWDCWISAWADYEFWCFTNDWGTTKIEWYSLRDQNANILVHYSMNNDVLTGYTRVQCDTIFQATTIKRPRAVTITLNWDSSLGDYITFSGSVYSISIQPSVNMDIIVHWDILHAKKWYVYSWNQWNDAILNATDIAFDTSLNGVTVDIIREESL